MRALRGANDGADDVNGELVERMDDLRVRVRALSEVSGARQLRSDEAAGDDALIQSEAFAAQTTMILRQTERIHELDMQVRDLNRTARSADGGADRAADRAIIEAQAERIAQLDSAAVRHAHNFASQMKTVLCWAEGFKELAAVATAVARRRQTEIDELHVLIGMERAACAGAAAAAALSRATEVKSLCTELDASRARLKV